MKCPFCGAEDTAVADTRLNDEGDVVRRRIDPSGTREVTVINQGQNRILVQVPGIEDPEALKRLIGQTSSR